MKIKSIILPLFAVLLAISPVAVADTGDESHQEDVVPYPLIHASHHGDISKVRRLLDSGANPNATDDNGNTALMWAASWRASSSGHVEMVKILLAAGANPNAADDLGGLTALHTAASWGQYTEAVEVIKILLSAGANLNATNDDGETALHYAEQQEHSDVIRVLRNFRASQSPQVYLAGLRTEHCVESWTPPCEVQETADVEVVAAAKTGNWKRVRALLAKGANVNAIGEDGRTALHYASLLGETSIANLLLQAGADPNVRDKLGKTAFYVAAAGGLLKLGEMLIASGADTDIADNEGKTAEEVVPLEKKEEFVAVREEAIQKREEQPVVVANSYDSAECPLCEPAKHGDIYGINHLLADGANPNAKLDNGWMALMFAALHGHAEIAEVLLSAGANPNATNEDGETALDIALFTEQYSNVDVSDVILVLQNFRPPETEIVAADVADATDDSQTEQVSPQTGKCLLCQAANQGNLEMAKILLETGHDPNATDKAGNTPSYYAVINGDTEMLKLLTQREKETRAQKEKEEQARQAEEERRRLEEERLRLEEERRIREEEEERRRLEEERRAAEERAELEREAAEKDAYQTAIRGGLSDWADFLGGEFGNGDYSQEIKDKVQSYVSARLKRGRTHLHNAARHLNLAQVRLLLQLGADVNAQSKRGITPLMFAVDGGDVKIVGVLTGAVDALENTIGGRTSDKKREINLREEVVRELLEAGANPHIADKFGKTAFSRAVKKNRISIKNILREYGAKK